MQFKIPHKRRLLCSAITLSLFPFSGMLHAQEQIEQIIVTGSFITRDTFNSTTPVQVMTEQSLIEQGTPNLGEVLRNSTFNYGVESVSNILAGNAQSAGVQGANFRGLGERATLTLINGRRTLNNNLANLYPQIMIERTDSLTAGGATIYGTDAVGGVFNIIPKTNYEGFAFQVGGNEADDWYENSFNFMAGLQGDRGGVVIAAEVRRKNALNFAERPEFSLGAASYSSTSWPGDFRVANRDITGAITDVSGRPDPGCGLNNEASGTPTEIKAAGTLGSRQGQLVGSCRWEFGANFDYQDEQDTFTVATLFDYEISDRLSYEGEIMFSGNTVVSRGSPSNPGGRIPELSAVPGTNPGNPYRAFFDADVDGRFDPDDGDLLMFAQDANGDGIPDRNQGVDLDGNGLDDVLVAGTDPAMGIPFNEDVLISDWRPVGYPFVGPSRLNSDATSNGAADAEYTTLRLVQQLNFDINDNWSGFGSYLYNFREYDGGGRDESLSAINSGLNGNLLVRDEATAGSRNAFFNPFTTQNFPCVNRNCDSGVRQTDPNQINTPDIYDQVAFDSNNRITETLQVVESVITGDLFDVPGGTVLSAFGMQYRDESYELDANNVSNALDLWIGVGTPDYTQDRQTLALFAEFSVPLVDSLAMDFSIRDEMVNDDSVNDLDQTTYSVGFNWTPLEYASFRASWNSSFIAPSLPQLYDSPTLQGLSQTTDPFTGSSEFTARTTGGTPSLRPEQADIWNIGATLSFLDDDLTVSVDYKYFDFSDRIIRPASQEVLDAEADIAVANGFALSAAGLAAFEAAGLNNPGIIRSQQPGRLLELVTTDQLNAQSMEWRGADMSVNYAFDADEIPFIGGDYGEFNAGLDATYIESYDFTSFTGAEIGGAGSRNNRVSAVPPTPRWKANARFAWNMNNHQVTVFGRYLHSLNDVRDGDPFSSPNPATRGFFRLLGVTNPTPDRLASYTTWDIQYSTSFESLFDGDTSVQLGVLNAFDREPQALVTLGGLETSLYDPRLRTFYARLRHEF
ncbi:MAG: iron complex outermembrane receptor protein [Pseudohongiellaceae bacterium]|jgi:iron complex outermembrane receptor protein